METIDISGSFRKAMTCDGTHGVDPAIVNEGLGSALMRYADKAVGGLFAKNITKARKKSSKWANAFKEAMGDISHTLRRDIEKISQFGGNASKWSEVVSGDLTQHVTKGLTGKGGMPANFCISTLKMPNGKTVNDIPLAWAICTQSSMFDMVNNKRDDLPRLSELLGVVANTINIAAYMSKATPIGKAPYNDVASFLASGGGGQLASATEYDEDKDELYLESITALFQNGWRPANMQAMAGAINILCSQYYIQTFSFLANNEIVAFSEQWYEANKHLWGWNGDTEPTNEAGQDFDEQVRSKLVRANTAKVDGPMNNAKIAYAVVPAIADLADENENVAPRDVVATISGLVKEFQSAKSKNAFEEFKKAAEALDKTVGESVISEREGEEGADSEDDDFGDEDAAFNSDAVDGDKKDEAPKEEPKKSSKEFEDVKAKLKAFFDTIGVNQENKDIAKVCNNDEDAVNEWKESAKKVTDWLDKWSEPVEQKPKDDKSDEKKSEGDKEIPKAEDNAKPEDGNEDNAESSEKSGEGTADNSGTSDSGDASAKA